jgi:HD-GYP domain-containing protein (c-di-GMP phosphodiesterase class II)
MNNIKHEKIPVSALELGMFIAELDKPWIESDFLLQGFVLEDAIDLEKVRSTCKHVYIDRTRSIGNQFTAMEKPKVAIKRAHTVRIRTTPQPDNLKTPILNKARRGEKVSFADILREVKNYQPLRNAESKDADGTIFNVRGADATLQTTLPYNHSNPKEKRITKGGFFSSLGGVVNNLFSRNKLKTSVTFENVDIELSHLSEEEKVIYELEPPVEEEIAHIYPVFEKSELVTRDLFNNIALNNQIDITGVSDVLDNMVESIGRTPDALLWLAKLKKADGLAYNLALNVSVTLMAFNSFLAFSKEQIKMSGLAGLLQDVGKVKLSTDVLLKNGKLTREEYEYAQKHVDESIKILRATPDIPKEVLRLIAEHHERVDGSGYPFQIKGDKLSLQSQAAGLIDTYCAMTNHRSYAQGAYHQQALDEIHALSGKQFSAEIIDQLIQFMGIYPVSSLVELNTGEIGVVIQQNQVRRLMPRVMLLLDHEKKRYQAPVVLDLIHKPMTPNGDVYAISKGVPADSYGLDPSEFYV